MNLDTLLIQFLNGLVLSMLLFMTAAGLSLILGLMDVINLIHGSAYLLGGYIGLTIIRRTGNLGLAVIVAPVLVGLLGLVLEQLFLRRLYRSGHLYQVLFTFGAALVAADLMRWNWGSDVQSIPPPPVLARSVIIIGNQFPLYRLTVILMGILMAILLWMLLERTRIGAIVRAGVADSQMVSALGINIQRVFALVYALGMALAALSGVLAGPILNLYPGLDFEILILAMVIVVVGGLGTFRGVLWGALLIGMTDTFGKAYFPQVSLFVIFVAMALILVFRPAGLAGQQRLG
jgi:branched-subunit amino acid ABC-type transport system permease component